MTRHLDRVDLGLFALGVLGLALFAWLLPGQHPDAAASYALGRERAVEEARAFLERRGFVTDGLVPHARLGHVPRLLDSLQREVGRAEAIRLLRGDAAERLPVHHWEVTWRKAAERVSMMPGAAVSALVLEVYLTPGGRPWRLVNPQAILPGEGVDREALRALLLAEPEMGEMLTAPPDSALDALLYFDLSSASQLADSAALLSADRDRLREAALTGRPQGLGEAAAAEIARHHLAATALAVLPFAVASVEALPERGRAAARVRLEAAEPVLGQRPSVDVDVTAAGALIQLDAIFTREEPEVEQSGNIVISDGDGSWRGVASALGYVGLVLLLLVVLFRRLSARALDARAALKDALVAGVLGAAATALTAPMFSASMGYSWQFVLFLGVGTVFSGAGLGLLVFVASAASDALARATWPEQIATLSLVRQSAWVNEPVGRSLVRGAAGAGVLVGMATLLLALLPGGLWGGDGSTILNAEGTLSLVLQSFTQRGWQALLVVFAVFVGLGSLLRRWHPRLVVPGLALAVGVLGLPVVDLPTGPWAVAWGAPLAAGLVLAGLYRRYDALTLLVALVLAGVLWDTAEGWLAAGSPAWLDAVLGGALLVGVAGLGAAGVRSGRSGEALPRYEPDYVVEQRERGRLQRELEIAREVQRSFLPAQTPEVPGLDLAARCLAAEEVGGDYYDFVALGPDRLGLVIGDVSGKGIHAAFFMTLAKGFLQTLAREVESPAELLRRANRLFCANAPRGTFISLIYGVFDLGRGTLTFARAGHTPVIAKRGEPGSAAFLQPPGLALGLTTGPRFDETIREQTLPLRPGDAFVFYTDGFSEAMDARHALYTDERLADAIAAADGAAADLLQAALDDVAAHAAGAGQHDDMTMVVVRVAESVGADGRVRADAAVPTS